MKRTIIVIALYFWASWVTAQVTRIGDAEFSGNLAGAKDLSALQLAGNFLVIASDETTVVQLFEKQANSHYQENSFIQLLAESYTEIDIEALALEGNTLYVLGSHSRSRKKVYKNASRDENRARLASHHHELSRDNLFRLELDLESGKPTSAIETVSLRSLFSNNPVLGIFADIPGKENGIDFEGMAVHEQRLYLGLRGPVLRGNYVPVLSLDFDDVGKCTDAFDAHPDECRLLYVNLGGRGIRSLHQVQDGILVLAGPTNDGRFSYELYYWDGQDCVPDKGSSGCQLDLLGEIPRVPGGSEGFTVLGENPRGWEILVVYDGIDGGAPALLQVQRP